ncbi:MAG: N-formylglutamate amidohydrolase [Deltaproteobacteria bacterium]|jgi:hypothetical protein|nr:N-formylglutamate amidohydrolase [Deltaproteobacteria bacterium]MBW2534811.1 N-formylglutamate amidohydrolase [Deltaproteobacteria bacterium]
MERLPLAVSLPHSGTRIPTEVARLTRLTEDDVAKASHAGLAELCGTLIERVEVFATTRIAPLFVDLDCAPDDCSPFGVIKRDTPWQAPVYREFPSKQLVSSLLDRYHRPYHHQLGLRAHRAMLGLDFHALPCSSRSADDPDGKEAASLHPGPTVPCAWTRALAAAFERRLGVEPFIHWRDTPGFITRSAPGGIPWIRIELPTASLRDPPLDAAGLIGLLESFYRAVQQRSRR